jgi:D-lactate dehydrogenase (cytochrome)
MRALTAQDTEFLHDESRLLGQAESISFPQTEADVQGIMRQLAAGRMRVTVQGARTGISGAAVPQGGHILNLSRMNKILGLRYEAKENCYLLRVQPGLLLCHLRQVLESKNFHITDWDQASRQALGRFKQGNWVFWPDPTEISASIGGMVACNASGARTFAFGPTRNHVQSLHIVLADGSLLQLRRGQYVAKGRKFSLKLPNGRLISGSLPAYDMPKVKNSCGYYCHDDMDLLDLFIGDEGSLGIVTEIELRIYPMPAALWGITTFWPDEEKALAYVRALRDQHPGLVFKQRPLAIEFFNEAALRFLRQQKQERAAFGQIQRIEPHYHTAVYAEFMADGRQKMRLIIDDLGDLITAVGGNEADTWVATNAYDLEKLRLFRHAVPKAVNLLLDEKRKKEPSLTKLGTDMSVPDQFLEKIMTIYNQGLAANALQAVIFGHVGNNHLHVGIIPENQEQYRQGQELYLAWAQQVVAMGGSVAAEHGAGKLKMALVQKMFGRQSIEEMRRLKRLFDPHGLINNGNIFAWEETDHD